MRSSGGPPTGIIPRQTPLPRPTGPGSSRSPSPSLCRLRHSDRSRSHTRMRRPDRFMMHRSHRRNWCHRCLMTGFNHRHRRCRFHWLAGTGTSSVGGGSAGGSTAAAAAGAPSTKLTSTVVSAVGKGTAAVSRRKPKSSNREKITHVHNRLPPAHGAGFSCVSIEIFVIPNRRTRSSTSTAQPVRQRLL